MVAVSFGTGLMRAPSRAGEFGFYGPILKSQPALPPYPTDWRVRGFEGLVNVKVTVDTSGAVATESITSSGYADTDSAAAWFARACRFEPYRTTQGKPESTTIGFSVAFAHPTSANLVAAAQDMATVEGMVSDDAGRPVRVVASLHCVAKLDSVTGSIHYSYDLTCDSMGAAKLLYVGMYPVEAAAVREQPTVLESPSAHSTRIWSGFRGCSGHIDVFGWMANNPDRSRDPRAYGLDPGESLKGLGFESLNPPEVGHWIVGGGRGCGPACFPWADSCDLGSRLTGRTVVPGNGLYARGSLGGEVDGPAGYPVPGAKVAVLGAGRDTTAAANGAYLLKDLPPGQFRVRASAPGFESAERWVDIGLSHAFCNLKLRSPDTGVR